MRNKIYIREKTCQREDREYRIGKDRITDKIEDGTGNCIGDAIGQKDIGKDIVQSLIVKIPVTHTLQPLLALPKAPEHSPAFPRRNYFHAHSLTFH